MQEDLTGVSFIGLNDDIVTLGSIIRDYDIIIDTSNDIDGTKKNIFREKIK